jgi:hypothetical protein
MTGEHAHRISQWLRWQARRAAGRRRRAESVSFVVGAAIALVLAAVLAVVTR